jgi:hypothetical protein
VTDPLNVLMSVALFAQLDSPDLTTPATPIAWPFVEYIPVTGAAYLEVHSLLRAQPKHWNMNFDGSDILNGIFQVDAVVPDGKGEAPGMRLATLVAQRFVIGTEMVCGTGSDARKLQVNNVPKIAAAVKDAPWIRFPVSVPYQLIT